MPALDDVIVSVTLADLIRRAHAKNPNLGLPTNGGGYGHFEHGCGRADRLLRSDDDLRGIPPPCPYPPTHRRSSRTDRCINQRETMKLYKTYGTKTGEPDVVSWQASQTDAGKTRAELRRQGLKAESQTVEVPTSKGPLIEWLNANVKA